MPEWTWVYKASEDDNLLQTQPPQVEQDLSRLSSFWPFNMSGPFNQEFGNNLFLSDPSSQQQENFVAFDQDDEGFGEYDDYDDGEISDEEEGEQGAPVTSGGDQGAAPTKHTDVKQNSAKQGVAQPSPAAAGEKVRDKWECSNHIKRASRYWNLAASTCRVIPSRHQVLYSARGYLLTKSF